MSNTYSGTGGASGLEVRTVNLATDLFGIDIIEVSNGTLVVGASPNIARITTGGGGGGGGTVTSVGLTAPAAFTIGGSPVTGAGTLTITGAGTALQYIDGTGALQTTPTGTVTSVALTETGSALTITGSPITGAGTFNIAGAGANTQVILGDLSLGTLTTGTIEGTIADTQVAYGTAADTIGGEPELTYIDTAGSRKFNILDSDAGTTTVLYPLKVSRISTGTAAVGLGVGLEFEAEAPAQAGVNVVGSILESISTAGTTAANTRFDLVIKNHNGSGDPALTNEVARFTSTGGFTTTSSVAGGTTVGIDPGAGGTVTVGGTGGVTTTNGPITAVGATGAVSAQTKVTGGTGVVATTGGVLASAGGVTATLGNIVATAGNIDATAGSVSAGADVEVGTAGAGNVIALVGYTSQIAGQRVNVPVINGSDLGDVGGGYFGAVQPLAGDNYTIGVFGFGELGSTATFLSTAATATVAIDGVNVTSVIGGGAVGAVGFTCPVNESFTICFIDPSTVFVFGNVTVV
jgi:hypothetical protein